MFLALKEMKKEKSRFAMILLVTILIAYLVYFLSSLAFGLAQINRTAVDYWNAEGIILSEASNQNIYASTIDINEISDAIDDTSHTINVISTTARISENQSEDPFNIVLIGSDTIETISPPLMEGRSVDNFDEIIVSKSLKAKLDFKVNDTLTLASTDREFKVVGITDDANFNTLPVAYVTRDMASQNSVMYKDGSDVNSVATPNTPQRVSAILVSENMDIQSLNRDTLRYFSIGEFINGLPGYQAQVLTFGLMIGSLSLISTIIIGIFMYILTMQKKSVFAVLKIQGYKDRYIISSVIFQTLMLTLLGFTIAYILAYLTVLFIPKSVPVAINVTLFIGITLFALLSSLFGTLFSAKSILKIDPLEAL